MKIKIRTSVVSVVVGVVVAGLLSACGDDAAREAKRVKMRVTGVQNVSGRWVFAAFEMEGPNAKAHFIYSPTNPVVVWAGHQAMVESERVLLDGEEFAAIPPAATNIYLAVTSGLFAVRSDGIEVKAMRMAK